MTRSPFRSIIAVMAMACLSLPAVAIVGAERAWRSCRAAIAGLWHFVSYELPRFVWDRACAAVNHVLSVFRDRGVFSTHLQRIADAVRTTYRAWRTSPAQAHYRAPGSWVACAST